MREPVKNALKLLNSANQLSKEEAFNSLGVLIFFLMCCSLRNTRKGMKQGEECDRWGSIQERKPEIIGGRAGAA